MRYFLVLSLTFVSLFSAQATEPPREWNLVMGNPSNATTDATLRNNYLVTKRYYALSYNDEKGGPNWVSWHLSSYYLGTAPRKPEFDPDTTLPTGFRRITHQDYTGSGFDRGHMCPHSDRALDRDMSFMTFIMTNIVPQSHENNTGAWEQLEEYGRYLANQQKDLFIVSGPIGRGGVGNRSPEPVETIANGRVVVPRSVFKVLMVVDRNSHERPLEWVDANTRLIAVIMPNDRTVPETDWARYRVPVADVEAATGYTFFSAASAEVLGPKKRVRDSVAIPVLPNPHRPH